LNTVGNGKNNDRQGGSHRQNIDGPGSDGWLTAWIIWESWTLVVLGVLSIAFAIYLLAEWLGLTGSRIFNDRNRWGGILFLPVLGVVLIGLGKYSLKVTKVDVRRHKWWA